MDVASPRADAGFAVLFGRDGELARLYDLIDGIGRRGGALVVRRAGARVRAGPNDTARLLRAALQLGLPLHERALASFKVETLEPTWSGAATVRSFARIAQQLAEAGHEDQALQTLQAIALRAHWEHVDHETRRDLAEITERLAGSPDEPARLATLALFDPVGQGAEILRRVRLTAPLDVPNPDAQFEVATAAAAVWADNLALPFLRAASAGYRADGRLALLAHRPAGGGGSLESGDRRAPLPLPPYRRLAPVPDISEARRDLSLTAARCALPGRV